MSSFVHTWMALCSIIYMRDKTQDIRYFVLTLFAIIKELEKASALSPSLTAELAAGLPPEHYSVLKDRFTAYFKRKSQYDLSIKAAPMLSSSPEYLYSPSVLLLCACRKSKRICSFNCLCVLKRACSPAHGEAAAVCGIFSADALGLIQKDRDLVTLMAPAGCTAIWFSVIG